MAASSFALKVPEGVSISFSTMSPRAIILTGQLQAMRELSRALVEAGELIEMDVSEKEVMRSHDADGNVVWEGREP